MTQSAIIDSVESLQDLLDSTQMLSPEEQQAISQLESQIEQMLFAHDAEQDPEKYLLNRFEDRLLSFEQQHPSLSSVIRKLSNSLSNIGV